MRVRTGGENAVLRALELRRRNHLHRFRDLLGFLDGVDLPSNGLKTRHDGSWCRPSIGWVEAKREKLPLWGQVGQA